MFFSENHRLSKPHFDWPLLIASYMLALYGVLAITIANYDPTLGADRSLQDLIMDANNGRLQLMWVVVSMVVVALMMTIKYDIIGRLWPVIYVVDVGGCVGESVGQEIAYARQLGKSVVFDSQTPPGTPI